jgi:hypothetical protein
MLTKNPHIPGHRDGALRFFGNGVIVGEAFACLVRFAQQFLDFILGETDDIEVEPFFLERFQLDPQHFLVPPGAKRQAVIREHQGPPLRRCQVIQHDDRNFGHFELPGRSQARVACDDHPVRPDQNRVGPPEFDDAGRHLRHLLVRVGASVPCVGQQLLH